MNVLRTILLEIWGLFVEDWSFTIAIVVCIAIAIFVFPYVGISPEWCGVTLFAILALVLLENVRRSARR